VPTPRHVSLAAFDPVETVTPPNLRVRAGPTGSCCYFHSTPVATLLEIAGLLMAGQSHEQRLRSWMGFAPPRPDGADYSFLDAFPGLRPLWRTSSGAIFDLSLREEGLLSTRRCVKPNQACQ
jgi:hypothetical protein